MKKLSIFMAMAAVALGFTSCEEDHDSPVYKAPTEFVLNTPAYANNTVILAPGQNVAVTCSQPDYGYSAVTNYSLDVSLSEVFTTAEDGTTNFYTITSKNKTLANIDIAAAEWSTAILTLLGINSFEQFPEEGVEPTTIYVRALAQLTGIESSKIYSNTIKLEMEPFNPYLEGGKKIYIAGINDKWGIDTATPDTYADRALTETTKGSNIYLGAFNVNAGDVYFRFYTELGSWGNDNELPSFGGGGVDNTNKEISFSGEILDLTAVPGKGNFLIKDWPGGYITFTVNLNDMDNIKVTLQKGDLDPAGKAFIYLVGACSAWSVDDSAAEEIYAPFKLYDWKGDGVYSGIFNVDADKAMFRFYTELGDWGTGSIGAGTGEGNIDLTWSGDSYNGAAFDGGKDNWNFTNWAGGKMKMVVDVENLKVEFSTVAE